MHLNAHILQQEACNNVDVDTMTAAMSKCTEIQRTSLELRSPRVSEKHQLRLVANLTDKLLYARICNSGQSTIVHETLV